MIQCMQMQLARASCVAYLCAERHVCVISISKLGAMFRQRAHSCSLLLHFVMRLRCVVAGKVVKIPAKKWGDTEIAERGRSVLVMRARFRSTGLTPHQRGWTDAG